MIATFKNILIATGRLAASYWASHTTKGRIWLTMGVIALIVDAVLCYQYGVTQTVWHGIGFAVVALFFSQLPDGAYEEFQKGNKGAGIVLGLLCIPLGAVAYQSHIGYGAGVRMGDIKKANVQQAKYDGAQDTVSEDKENLKLWTARLKMLLEQDAWTATVKADGLREELANLKGRVEEEKQGKRGRKAGCGKECERLQDQIKDVATRLGKVEEKETLTAQIEGTKRKLDAARVAAASTDAGLSSVAMQTDVNTQLIGMIRASLTGEPLETALKTTEQSTKIANLLITAAGSLAFMLMAPVGFFMAGRNRKAEREEHSAHLGADDIHLATAQNQQGQTSVTREITRLDPMVKHEVHEIKERDPRISSLDAFLASYITRAA